LAQVTVQGFVRTSTSHHLIHEIAATDARAGEDEGSGNFLDLEQSRENSQLAFFVDESIPLIDRILVKLLALDGDRLWRMHVVISQIADLRKYGR